jgi:hypothetical protein
VDLDAEYRTLVSVVQILRAHPASRLPAGDKSGCAVSIRRIRTRLAVDALARSRRHQRRGSRRHRSNRLFAFQNRPFAFRNSAAIESFLRVQRKNRDAVASRAMLKSSFRCCRRNLSFPYAFLNRSNSWRLNGTRTSALAFGRANSGDPSVVAVLRPLSRATTAFCVN